MKRLGISSNLAEIISELIVEIVNSNSQKAYEVMLLCVCVPDNF